MQSYLFKAVIVLLLSGFFAACDWVGDEDEAHTEAEGFRLVVDGVDSVIVAEQGTTGRLQVSIGEETRVEVRFTDGHGQIIPEEQIADGSLLIVEILDGTLADVLMEFANPWAFRLRGKAAGSTEVSIGLKHGDHIDFAPKEVTIEVVP